MYDIWFARYKGDLWVALATAGEPPLRPRKVYTSAGEYVRNIKSLYSVNQVGICPPDMLGLARP